MTRCSLRPLVAAAALIALGLTAPALSAAPPTPAAAAPAAVFAKTNYWNEFVEFWTGAVKRQSGVVLLVLGVGVVSLFIITRGKWKK